MRGRTILNAFNGGELSRRMEGRSDLDGIYDRALAKMLNFVATVEGPAMKRPGFRYIKAAASSATWLTPFIFNTTQAYVLEWAEQKLRFFTNGGQILAGGNPLELAIPYTAAQAPRVSTWQSYDRLYLAHPSHPPATLSRTGAETFAFNWLAFKDGPYKDWNSDKASTITWGAGAGTVDSIVTIASTRAIFKPGHVGGAFIFETHDFRSIKAWEPNVRLETIAIGALRRSDGKVYSLVQKVAPAGDVKIHTGTIQPTHYEGEEWDASGDELAGDGTTNNFAGGLWRYEYDRFGAGTITEFVSANQVKLRVTRRFPTSQATYKWALGAFSNAEGWPHLVTVWGQRLIFFKGTEVIGSVVGDFLNFSPLTPGGLYAPDMGFRRALGMVDPPLWVRADKETLIAGCARSEVVVGQINRAAGLSADNLRADEQSAYGSAEAWPVAIGTSLLFVQRGKRNVREARFGAEQDRFVAANLNIFSRHITRSGIRWLTFQQEPENMLWGGRGDGALIAHPHNPDQQIKGFSRVELAAGAAIAGCSIPSEDGNRDELWILAERNGAKSILQLADWWDEDAGLAIADAFFVDYGVSYAGAAKQSFTPLAHLEGETVQILADGKVHPPLKVQGGTVTLDWPASKVHIGLGYEGRLKFLRPAVRGLPGAAQGLRGRLVRLLARLIDSGPLAMLDKRGRADLMFHRENGLPMGEPAPLHNGDTKNLSTGNGSSYDSAGELVSSDPLPCIVSMAIATYELEEPEK